MKHTRRIPFITFILMAMATFSARAQQMEPIVTDRPDQTESASIVPAGWLQIEAGFLQESLAQRARALDGTTHDDALSGTSMQMPGMLLRFGVTEVMELRLGTAWVHEEFDRDLAIYDPTNRGNVAETFELGGLSPLSLGLKALLFSEQGWIPQTAVLASVSIPGTSSEDFDQSYLGQEFRLAFAHTLSERLSLGYNLGVSNDESAVAHTGFYSLALGAGVTDALGLFVEIFGDLPGDAPPVHKFDAGATWLLSPDLQLDASGGFTFAEDENGTHLRMEHFISAGVSWRFRIRN